MAGTRDVTGGLLCTGGATAGGEGAAQAASPPRMARPASHRPARRNDFEIMWVILLEALAALAILVLIVWWTMFSGRKDGERHRPEDEQ